MLVGCLLVGFLTKIEANEVTELQKKAKKAYAQIAPCLESAWIYEAKHRENQNATTPFSFSFPNDAEEHFQAVKKALERFHHSAHMHTYRHYSGPWIENIFITHFKHIALSDTHGIIPLFIPWVDNQRTGSKLWDDIFSTLKSVLRPNVIYLTVSQGDIGLANIAEYFPNILVLSGGGFGHVPIPLIKGEIPYREITSWPPHWDQEIGFFGNMQQASRPIMFDIIRREADNLGISHKIAFGPTWIQMMSKSKYNLAPRGFGRSSFRFAEAIHIGRVPVFLYDDVPWIPYLGSNISIETYGFMAGLNATVASLQLPALIHKLENTSDAEYRAKHEQVARIRQHFTYQGVMKQIERFFKNPFGEAEDGSDLRCTPRHPKQEHAELR